MELSFSFPWETALMAWLQARMGPGAVTVAALLSMLGEQVPVVAVFAFLYWCYDKKSGKFLAVNLCAVIMFNSMVKNLVLRRRPYCDHPRIRCLRPPEAKADIYGVGVLLNVMLTGSIPEKKRAEGKIWNIIENLQENYKMR